MSAHRAPAVIVDDAWALAHDLLGEGSERWRHTVGVTRPASELTSVVEPADRRLVVSAAWLHDIGCAAAVGADGYAEGQGPAVPPWDRSGARS